MIRIIRFSLILVFGLSLSSCGIPSNIVSLPAPTIAWQSATSYVVEYDQGLSTNLQGLDLYYKLYDSGQVNVTTEASNDIDEITTANDTVVSSSLPSFLTGLGFFKVREFGTDETNSVSPLIPLTSAEQSAGVSISLNFIDSPRASANASIVAWTGDSIGIMRSATSSGDYKEFLSGSYESGDLDAPAGFTTGNGSNIRIVVVAIAYGVDFPDIVNSVVAVPSKTNAFVNSN